MAGRPFGQDRYGFMRDWVNRACREHGGLRPVCHLAGIDKGRASVQNWLGGRDSEATGTKTKRRLPDQYGEALLDWLMENYEDVAQDPRSWSVWTPSVQLFVETEEKRERIQARIAALKAQLDELPTNPPGSL